MLVCHKKAEKKQVSDEVIKRFSVDKANDFCSDIVFRNCKTIFTLTAQSVEKSPQLLTIKMEETIKMFDLLICYTLENKV